jgi:hypothetical protein
MIFLCENMCRHGNFQIDIMNKKTQPEKIFLRSQGRCICNSNEQRKRCLNYEADKDGACRHLDKVLWIACLWRENE